MFGFFTERTLPTIQSTGMLLLAAVSTLGVGAFVTGSFVDHFEQGLSISEQKVIEVQETILDTRIDTIIARLDHEHRRLETDLRAQVRAFSRHALAIARNTYDTHVGVLPDARIKELIIANLRPLRFMHNRGYFFIDSFDGRSILMPPAPELEGSSHLANTSPVGHFVTRGLLEVLPRATPVSTSPMGATDTGEVEVREKITHVELFKPYGWIIGNGEYTDVFEADVQRQVLEEITGLGSSTNSHVMVVSADGALLAHGRGGGDTLTDDIALTFAQKNAIQTILMKARAGGGSIRYAWPRSSQSPPVENLARVTYYKPWGWVVVASIYSDDLGALLRDQRANLKTYVQGQISDLTWVVIGVLALALAFSVIFGRWVRRILDKYHADLAKSREHLKLQSHVFNSSGEAMIICDEKNTILAVNSAFSTITGYSSDEALGRNPTFLSSGRQDGAFLRAVWTEMTDGKGWSGEIWTRRRDGETFPGWLSVNAVRDASDRITHFISILTDISQRKAAENKIKELAFYDPLTQLPNRRLLMDRLDKAIAGTRRAEQHGAVLFIDLDNFKTLNDTQGHDRGDLLLIQVASRLSSCLREDDTVARQGGDEFVIILTNLGPREDIAATQVEHIHAKLAKALTQPYDLNGLRHHISASVGACLFDGENLSVETLLRHADTAMYQAKQSGKNRLCFFDPAIQEALVRRARMESELREALEREEFLCLYQPQTNQRGQVIGAEALLRWRHPTLGMVSPAAFIPLAEETGLIVPIGDWVLNQACAQLAIWADDPHTRDMTIAVNVSAVQFRDPDFIHRVEKALANHAIDPRVLKLELTESLVLENVEGTIETMRHLREWGMGFSMDDFGTGQSSLTYLKRLPLQQLKIDQSFVRDLTVDAHDATIVRTIIAMASSLGLDVLAEGVETEEQRDFLLGNGCVRFQGYLYGRPMEITDLETLMEADRAVG